MAKITKAEFETLPDSLKTKFKAVGNDYELIEAAPSEDVEGLKRSKAEILAEKKRLQDERDELLKFKTEHETAQTTAEEEILAKKGEFDTILANKEKAWNDRIEAETAKNNAMLANLKREKLTNLLVEKGVLPDRAKYLLGDLDGQLDLVSDENGFTIKKKGGIGDAVELDAVFESVKTSSPFFFAASNGSGSGASGSQVSGGGTPKTATKDQVKAMDAVTKREFYLAGGDVTN